MRLRGRVQNTLINRNYACLWYGQAISTTGTFMFDTTLTLWVATVLGKGRSWAPAATSGVFLAAVAATVIVGPMAGVFVDRWNRQRTMLHSETFRAALTFALFALALIPRQDLPIWVWLTAIYLVVFLLNAAANFFAPARFATIGQVVTGDADRARAAGIGQATTATAGIIGPPLAAPLLFVAGFQWALLVNALSFVVSYLAIRSVRLTAAAEQPPAPRRASAEFMEGLRFFAGNRFLVALLGLIVVTSLGTGAINSLAVFFVTRNLHAAPKYFGFLDTALGVGAIAGGLTAGAATRRIGAKTVTWLGTILAGLLLLLFARQTVFLPALVLLGVCGVVLTMLNAAMTPLMLREIPSQFMGRAMAVLSPAQQFAQMLSMALAGLLVSTGLRHFQPSVLGIRMGPIDTIFTGSGLLFVLAGVVALLAMPRDRAADDGTSTGVSSDSVDLESGS